MHQFTPEVLYAETVAKKRAFGDLSHQYAQAGNSFAAVHAAFAADVHTVQAVMWERVMVASPDPDAQFTQVAATVAAALAAYAAAPAVAVTAREVVEQARTGMGAAFDPAALRMLSEGLLPLDHLDQLSYPDPRTGAELAYNRTKGQNPVNVSRTRLRAAHDCMTMAVALNRDGNLNEAMRQAWAADWATLESYLLDAAAQVGDYALITVEMRWALASTAIATVQSLPNDFVEAVTVIRNRMVTVLGTVEGMRLSERFEPLT